MNDYEKYISIAAKELFDPTFEVTKQYLQVMDVEIENGAPRVARVDLNHARTSIAVYFHVKGERFFIVVNVSNDERPKVEWVWVESGHRAYLTATSKDINYEELSSWFPSGPLKGWSKGDMKPNGKVAYEFTRVSFEPNTNEAYGLKEKLIELLNCLDKSSDAVTNLSEKSEAYISVCRHQYISANAGINLNLEIIRRLSALNLELDIDTYITGREIE